MHVASVGNLLKPERVIQPVEMPLKETCDAKFGRHEIPENKLSPCRAWLIDEVVANVAFPQTEGNGGDEARSTDNVWVGLQDPSMHERPARRPPVST